MLDTQYSILIKDLNKLERHECLTIFWLRLAQPNIDHKSKQKSNFTKHLVETKFSTRLYILLFYKLLLYFLLKYDKNKIWEIPENK